MAQGCGLRKSEFERNDREKCVNGEKSSKAWLLTESAAIYRGHILIKLVCFWCHFHRIHANPRFNIWHLLFLLPYFADFIDFWLPDGRSEKGECSVTYRKNDETVKICWMFLLIILILMLMLMLILMVVANVGKILVWRSDISQHGRVAEL
jgi:hypothetical protein